MRPYLAVLLFGFAALVAGCAGGSGSAKLVPGSSPSSGAPHLGAASLSLKIPAQSRSGSAKRPAYVSPNTESVQIQAFPFVSPSAMPSVAPQTFPVTTPSPCSQNADGSKTCTFNVQAPLGEDEFIISTYAVASPGPSDVPLGVFQTGAIDVASGSTPAPINVTLTGVVTSVALTMQSPDPGISTSTQLQTVGTPLAGPNTLSITPLDASGAAILTDSFVSPITVTMRPTNAGVSLALTGSQCSPASSVSGATATITCAKDLGKLTYGYDGTIARDSSKSVVDRITFSAQPQASSSAPPTMLALTGTLVPVTIPAPIPLPSAPIANPYPFQFVRRSDGTFNYLAGSNPNSEFGSFDPSASTQSAPPTLGFVAAGIAVDQFGDIWIGVNNSGSGNSLQCFTSVSSSMTNAVSLPNGIAPFALTTDTSGNVWYYGLDANHTSWAGYFTPGSGCSTSGPMPNPAQFSTISDYPQTMVASPKDGSVWLLSNSNGNIYNLTTSSAGSVISTPNTIPSGSYFGEAMAVDGAGNVYASFTPNAALQSMLGQLPFGMTTLNMATVDPGDYPDGLDVYPANGTATRLAFAASSGLATVDPTGSFASNLQIFPITTHQNVTCFYDSNGDAWMAYSDLSSAPAVVHLIRTSVWTIADPSLSVPTTGGTVNINVSETGDSGPFTVSASDPTVATPGTPYSGIDHLLPLQFSANANNSAVTITVTDSHGRSETKTLSVVRYVPGARRRNAARVLTLPKRSW
ncbi:MAG: hypothetical protein JO322_00450 [Candidatus Eremiobacteraeota bacterium]|nr:hypothetical protein [Candidatus Eremiobacteraeota bacterium]